MTLVTPEIVFGISALILFVQAGIPLGLNTILVAHAVFNISVVTLIVRARFVGMSGDLEEASYDLGAGPLTTFWRVTLPRLAPAIFAGGLLAFTFSFDDFLTSFFVSGAGSPTLPLRIFSSLRFGVSPMVNATAVMILGLTLAASSSRTSSSAGPSRRAGRLPSFPASNRKEPMAMTVRTLQNFVGGEWVESTGENVRAIVSPVTGETLAEVPDASAEDVARAAQAARRRSRSGPRSRPGSARRSATRSPT